MHNHFDTIAEIYNTVWHFSEQYQAGMLANIIELLRLEPSDTLADVGGGTGVYTDLLRRTVGLRQAYCVEPSRNMWLEAQKIAGIESYCADAAGFMALDLAFSKVLLKEVVHHIPDRATFWQYLRGRLPADGRLLIVTRPQAIALPLFEDAKAGFRRKQPHSDALLAELAAAGFATELRLHPYEFTLPKATWFAMIRQRFMSDLAVFSDAEIEAGLAEIDAQYPGDSLLIPDTIVYIAAAPKP
ncbi:MAG: class I SAM-dependent methyltransferase [Candidatus Methylumidiphilus sp.]